MPHDTITEPDNVFGDGVFRLLADCQATGKMKTDLMVRKNVSTVELLSQFRSLIIKRRVSLFPSGA